MADQIYYSVFTKKGLELLTEAIQNGTKLGITSMAFGDGGGSLPVPNELFTKLVNEVHRTQLNSLAPDPNNANWLRAEAVIASAIGGFNIRELGLYAGDVLVAYSNYPATYKPNPSDGTARIMTFRMILQIDNTSSFDLVIDPDVVLATIQSVNDAKLELYENTVNQVETVAELSELDTWRGRQINIKSYHAPTNFALNNPYCGGGDFVYSPDLSELNNECTIINGWVRKLPQNTLSTYDIGLLGEIEKDGDATAKLQTLVDVLPARSTLNLFGDFSISRQILIKDKLSVTVNGHGSHLMANQENWELLKVSGKYFTFNSSYDDIEQNADASNYAWGVLSFLGVEYVSVDSLKITGANQNVYLDDFQMEGFQGGDAGIAAFSCKSYTVTNCTIQDVFSWGVFGTNITNATISHNTIKRCTHQSGISVNIPAAINQYKVDICSNYIEDIGLYGIELENHSASPSKANVYDNTMIDCFSGITAVGKAYKFRIYDNYAYNCQYGTWLASLTNTLPAEIYDNTYIGCYYGVIWQGAEIKANIHKNHTDGSPDEIIYRKMSADNIVWSIVDNKTFMHPSALTVGKTYYIDGVAVVISSSTASGQYVRNDTANRELYTIVITEAVITSTMKFKHVKTMLNTASVGEAGYVSATAALDVLCFNNHATNVNYGLLCVGPATDATKQERFFANILGRCIYQAMRVNSSGNLSRYFADNINVFNTASFWNGLVETGFIKLKQLESHTLAATTSKTENSVTTITYPANSLYSVIPYLQIHAIRVVLYGQNLASDAVIRLTITNGQTTTTYTAALSTFNGTASALFIMPSAFVTTAKTWGYTAVIDNEAKTLTYTSARLFYLTD